MKRTSPTTNSKPQLSLLLHTVDGVVPFLSPYLLETWFPPSDDFILGIAVRDTAVTPILDADRLKPRGFHFTPDFDVDQWVIGYQRMTVPTFDLVDDARRRQASSHTATDAHVSLWTSNGLMPLTPSTYTDIIKKYQSQSSVSLFDMVPSHPKSDNRHKNNPYWKRRDAAWRRCRTWLDALLLAAGDDDNAGECGRVWAAVAVDEEGEQGDLVYYSSSLTSPTIQGVALVGWQYMADATQRVRMLQALCQESSLTKVAVLSTLSLSQILEAAKSGCQVVGTELPTTWARSHQALAIDIVGWRSSKRPRTESTWNENGCVLLSPGDNPSSHAWFRDARAIVDGCQCLACQRHTRSYIYHLACAKELLAEILLFSHNLHHLLVLLREMRQALAEGKEEDLYKHVDGQLQKQ